MASELDLTVSHNKPGNSGNIGHHNEIENIVARGKCPHCDHRSAFRQVGVGSNSDTIGYSVPVKCDGCEATFTIAKESTGIRLYPNPTVTGVEDIPEPIQEYYQEALDCLSVGAPNGATTLFRKTIHAIAIHYDIASVDDDVLIYDMVDELHDEGHINEKLRRSLLAVKDLGNDGAHINENEPDLEQAMAIKDLIDAVLSATVIADRRIEYARENHPNDFLNGDDE